MVAIALTMATTTHATLTRVTGGATLPAIGYVGTAALSNSQILPAGAGSLFGVWSLTARNTVSYCQTGDDAGKNILAGVPNYNVQNPCPTDSTGTLHGFGAPLAGRPTLAWPSVVGADSPLSFTDLSNYSAHHSSTYLPVQFPSVVGAISIALNKTTAKGVVLNSSNTNFFDSQLCSIFSGAVTDWSDPSLASAFTLGAGDSIPAGPINVQYRADGSGATFGFSNHLSKVCGGTISQHFVTDQLFSRVVGLYKPTIPSNWNGVSGDSAVALAIRNTAGSIGYVGMANSQAAGISFAKVNGYDPSSFGAPVYISSRYIVTNQVISGADPLTGHPTLAAISPAPTTQCILLVTPDFYATSSSSYPIVAVSYLLGSSQGNGVDLPITQSLLATPYTTDQSKVTTIGVGTGLAFLAGTGISYSSVSTCVTN
jgi:phosphate transport system substrate-binding protein